MSKLTRIHSQTTRVHLHKSPCLQCVTRSQVVASTAEGVCYPCLHKSNRCRGAGWSVSKWLPLCGISSATARSMENSVHLFTQTLPHNSIKWENHLQTDWADWDFNTNNIIFFLAIHPSTLNTSVNSSEYVLFVSFHSCLCVSTHRQTVHSANWLRWNAIMHPKPIVIERNGTLIISFETDWPGWHTVGQTEMNVLFQR